MQTALIKIAFENGLHTRPAALLVKACKAFSSTIIIENNGMKVSAKDLMKLMSIDIGKDDIITLIIEGDDEVAAMKTLKPVILTLGLK